MGVKAPEVWSEIDSEFTIDNRGQLKKAINLDAVLSSIDNILRTRPGERVMLPDFASTMAAMLFEPMDQHLAGQVSSEVKRVIELWDDRVFVNSVEFYSNPDNNEISIMVQFQLRGYPNVFEFNKVL